MASRAWGRGVMSRRVGLYGALRCLASAGWPRLSRSARFPCVSSVAGGVVNWTRVLGIVLLRAGTALMTLRYEQI